ncbi:MAG: orotidine-5'-phosphate decarboxylase [Candidatus Omnitrophota bacterium]|nr:MAG: orotidine-5'-phosphate decarboxylase [Candidatus Omnitrophota bacterium]
MENFQQEVLKRVQQHESVLCVGLDTVTDKIPSVLLGESNPQLAFNRMMIDTTQDLVCCYKINAAFYFVRGADGLTTLIETIDYAHARQIPVILDAKWGDIGHTAKFYARAAFETLKADAVTLNPYMGEDAIAPFRSYSSNCSFVLCFTSNKSRNDLETLPITQMDRPSTPLYHVVAEKIRDWNHAGNLGAVVGATAPEELASIRELLGPSIPILCPGIGAQGGDLEEVLWAGYSGPGSILINISRAILNASDGPDFAESARREAEMFVDQMKAFFLQIKEE